LAYTEGILSIHRFQLICPSNRQTVFLTNNFTLPTSSITDLYRCRWQVELFFKWIKQHLRIKAFFGTSENADTNLDRHLGLRARGDHEKASRPTRRVSMKTYRSSASRRSSEPRWIGYLRVAPAISMRPHRATR
jgi:hypothetical protein